MKEDTEMEPEHILGIQLFFLGGIALSYIEPLTESDAMSVFILTLFSNIFDSFVMSSEIIHRYLATAGRFIVCLLSCQALELACKGIFSAVQTRAVPALKLKDKFKPSLYVLVASIAFLVYHDHTLLREDIVILMMACVCVRFLESKRQSATITYGEGMACSFSEGYLYLVIPNDGVRFVGIDETIRVVESAERVVFPVRRLFIVITKTLYCPPNLEEFNKNDDRLPRVEACRSLPDVERDVAGVRGRIYRNSAYKIRRGPQDARPVHVVAECATPLHTLWKVLQKRAVYKRLAIADAEEIQANFCVTLQRIIEDSPELRGKCTLVYYDNTNPNENIAEILLAKIREIEPDYEQITRRE